MQRYEQPSLMYHFFYKGQKIFGIVLLFWFLRQLKSYNQSIKSYYSFIEPIKLKWLRNFTIIQIIIYGISFFAFLIYNFGFVEDISTVYIVLNTGIVLATFYLSFYGIQQYNLAQFNAIISDQTNNQTLLNTAEEKIQETEKNGKAFSLPENRENKIYEDVLSLNEKAKI